MGTSGGTRAWRASAKSANSGPRSRRRSGAMNGLSSTAPAGNSACAWGTGMSRPTEPWRRHGLFWTPFLSVLSALYRLGWACARLFQPPRPWQAGIPVLSVGNLSVGGTGKSVLVRALAERALRRKKKPAILLRGYGAAPGPRPLLVSEGKGPRANAREAGDEAVEHAQDCACAVWVDADRVRAARAARKRGVDCLVLDDGFQRRRHVGRDLDLL